MYSSVLGYYSSISPLEGMPGMYTKCTKPAGYADLVSGHRCIICGRLHFLNEMQYFDSECFKKAAPLWSMGVWEYESMGVWEYESMGVWEYESMGV